MGWTHNWQRGIELPADAFARAVEDCRRVVAHIAVPLAGMDQTGDPIFRNDVIIFNGSAGAGCEPFEIHQTEFDRRGGKIVWSFCKTEHAPYDICVKAALIVLKHHLGEALVVGSDGKDPDWADARKTCQEFFGYGADFRLARD